MTITALALFSGGLDSILACRVVAAQGIRVAAVKFVSPFFGYSLLEKEAEYLKEIHAKFGVELYLRDVGEAYLQMLRAPAHGFGKHYNPCVDCKILLVSEARKMMPEFGASFLVTGEVLGQRPMSQRLDTLRIIERDSGASGLLLRPLCARHLPPTRPELEGLVDREKLLGFKGRSRTPQMELAGQFGIGDYPTPAGGCILTDPIVGKRIELFHEKYDPVTASDMLLVQVGRQFLLPGGSWLAMGRRHADNEAIGKLAGKGDCVLKAANRPGPTALLRYIRDEGDVRLAASLVVRYCKGGRDLAEPVGVLVSRDDGEAKIMAMPLRDDVFQEWMR